MSPIVCGILRPSPPPGSASTCLSLARTQGFSFALHPLSSSPAARRDLMELSSDDWCGSVVGVIQPGDDAGRQVDFATWLSIPAVCFPPCFAADPSFPGTLSATATKLMGTSTSLWVSLPLLSAPYALAASLATSSRTSNLGFDLHFPAADADLPALPTLFVLLHRLLGLRVSAVTLPASLFLTNKQGYPTLSKKMQAALSHLIVRGRDKLRFVIEGPAAHPEEQPDNFAPYLQYLQHLRSRSAISALMDSEEAVAEKGYLDYLQAPLQPLADHLEFQTYETFERDPVKYANYQSAVYLALRDGVSSKRWSDTDVVPVTVAVVGAGRGPLVRGCLNALARYAAENPGRRLEPRVVALEKNPSAVAYLNSLVAFDPLFKDVEIVSGDMRKSGNPFTADIIVSELLGSFGDNELSPECLDGAQLSGLMTESTISIPADYTALVAPLTSVTLLNNAKAQGFSGAANPIEGPMGQTMGYLRAVETPYVVRTCMASQTHPEQPCWSFVHPNPNAAEEGCNERSCEVEWSANTDFGMGYSSGYQAVDAAMRSALLEAEETEADKTLRKGGVMIHGLSGTFDSLLYKSEQTGEEERISIAPKNFSTGMFSWFPLYFPLREPMMIPDGGKVKVNMWRKVSAAEGKVWFEWMVTSYDRDGGMVAVSNIHNPEGRSYSVGL